MRQRVSRGGMMVRRDWDGVGTKLGYDCNIVGI